jgi:hypothetical protein
MKSVYNRVTLGIYGISATIDIDYILLVPKMPLVPSANIMLENE